MKKIFSAFRANIKVKIFSLLRANKNRGGTGWESRGTAGSRPGLAQGSSGCEGPFGVLNMERGSSADLTFASEPSQWVRPGGGMDETPLNS